MSKPRAEVHVGDTRTTYYMPIYDDDLAETNFDPSDAATKTIYFKMPGQSALLPRAGTPVQKVINGVSTWCLSYTVTPADVIAGFHQETGRVSMQAKLTYADGSVFSSTTLTVDFEGNDMRVYPNLEA